MSEILKQIQAKVAESVRLSDADFVVMERIVNDIGSTHQLYNPNRDVSGTPPEIRNLCLMKFIENDEFDHAEFKGMVVPHWRVTELGIIAFKEYVYRRMCDLGRLGSIINIEEKSRAQR
jgi:hypothetical protein